MPFYKANSSYNASLSADYTVGDGTLSVSSVPSNFPTIVTVARGTSKKTRFTVTGGGSGLLTGITRLDGANENITSGASVEIMNDADFINQVATAIYTQSNLKDLIYAADGGATDTYAITLASVPATYTELIGLPISFKANTINTGACTLNVNSLGAKAIKKNYTQDLADGDIQANQIVTVIYDGTNFQIQIAASSVTYDNLKASQGFLINGKIVPSVTSNNLKVELKGTNGVDPSSSNPVYVRIGDTIRTITSAISVTLNAGTNWFNAGSAELATIEVDYFVYLGYNATDGVTIGVSRLPHARQYSDFSVTSTNERHASISVITTAAATDYYENIGRFAATLSAGAGYTWTVPTFTAINLINRPIFETRVLEWVPTHTGSGSMTVSAITNNRTKYKITEDRLEFDLGYSLTTGGTASNKLISTLPFSRTATENEFPIGTGYLGDGTQFQAMAHFNSTDTNKVAVSKYNEANYALIAVSMFGVRGSYFI